MRPARKGWQNLAALQALVATCALLSAEAGTDDRGPTKFSDTAKNIAANLRTNILAEVQQLPGHAWAGEYFSGGGRIGTLFNVAPASGFVFERYGCMELYDRNYGAVTETNGHIRLAFTFANTRDWIHGVRGISPELIPVSWGQRHYLIPADDVVGFCNEVNEGSGSGYLLRRGDEKVAVTGFPNVPPGYQSYLLSKPIEANITAVGAYKARGDTANEKRGAIPVTLDAGKNQGVKVGMKFHVIKPDNAVQWATVTAVHADQSEADMIRVLESDPHPKPGWRLSTRVRWHDTNREKQ